MNQKHFFIIFSIYLKKLGNYRNFKDSKIINFFSFKAYFTFLGIASVIVCDQIVLEY